MTDRKKRLVAQDCTGETVVVGRISKWWQNQHGRQLGIATTLSGASGVLLGLAAFQLLFLQNDVNWSEFTGQAIGLAVFASIFLMIVLPEFFALRGQLAVLEELKTIDSKSELRRRKAEGDQAAETLGAGHLVAWTAFLESKGLRR